MAGYIGITELIKASDIIASNTFDYFFPLIIVAIKFGFLEDKPMMATAEGNAQEVDDDEDF